MTIGLARRRLAALPMARIRGPSQRTGWTSECSWGRLPRSAAPCRTDRRPGVRHTPGAPLSEGRQVKRAPISVYVNEKEGDARGCGWTLRGSWPGRWGDRTANKTRSPLERGHGHWQDRSVCYRCYGLQHLHQFITSVRRCADLLPRDTGPRLGPACAAHVTTGPGQNTEPTCSLREGIYARRFQSIGPGCSDWGVHPRKGAGGPSRRQDPPAHEAAGRVWRPRHAVCAGEAGRSGCPC
jgi:hypothetical protein